jgi:hypothetical protein
MGKKQRFLFSVEKLHSGKFQPRSTGIVSQAEAEKLHWIFQNYAGQRKDFQLFFDEFETERVPLSHLHSYCQPLSPIEETLLKKLKLESTGIITPLDILEEFEALEGELVFDPESNNYRMADELEDPIEDEDLETQERSIII